MADRRFPSGRFGVYGGLAMAVVMLAAGSAVQAQTQYQFTTLDDPLGTEGTILNGTSGNIIVGQYTDSLGVHHGFLSSGSTFKTLDDPLAGNGANQGTIVTGIDGGNVVGTYTNGQNVLNGFEYNGSQYVTLNVPGSSQTTIGGISGTTIVGSYDNNGKVQGFSLNGTSFTTLNSPFNPNSTFATGVSTGRIVGYASVQQLGLAGSSASGFEYDGNMYSMLQDPLSDATFPTGISGNTIVGYYQLGSVDLNNFSVNGFVFDGLTYSTLNDPLGVDGTTAMGTNGTMIVGYYRDSNNMPHGFIATPIPEPTGLLGVGLCCLSLLRRRRTRLKTVADF